ncbi:MAG: hypothetical protein ACRDHD_09070, partial [Candidatus Limnocylindria bacterium]
AGAAVAAALGRVPPTRAAAGDPLRLGQNNFAGSSATRLSATSSGGAFWMTQNGSGSGVRGESINGTGGVFETRHADRQGLLAQNIAPGSGSGAAVRAVGNQNTGIVASTNGAGRYGVEAVNSATSGGPAIALYGQSDSTGGSGVYGYAPAATGSTAGVAGKSESTGGLGVFGWANAASGPTNGVSGQTASTEGAGVFGTAYAASGTTYGVYGSSASPDGTGVVGSAYAASGTTLGVYGESSSPDGTGVRGYASAETGENYGVYGVSESPSGFAGFFGGNVNVTGTLSKGGGAFRIDHPLDPANRILQHSFVESPDMLNIYGGTVATDADGHATVQLPAYFAALNADVRYQLTPIGDARAWVSAELADNRFAVATDRPHTKVCWQLTGIRRDAWAEAHRITVELDKPAAERGSYLHPLEHGQPASAGVDYADRERLREQAARAPQMLSQPIGPGA